MKASGLVTTKKSFLFEFLVVFLIALLARGNAIFTLTWACDDLLSLADPTGAYFSQDQFSQLR
ncbi:MAG: hypothetical protein VKO44_07180, partial [Cyanobacteriota bacterium]|nr:hypothetical protein [Cyanobacteriota bacterium]